MSHNIKYLPPPPLSSSGRQWRPKQQQQQRQCGAAAVVLSATAAATAAAAADQAPARHSDTALTWSNSDHDLVSAIMKTRRRREKAPPTTPRRHRDFWSNHRAHQASSHATLGRCSSSSRSVGSCIRPLPTADPTGLHREAPHTTSGINKTTIN